MLASWWTEVSRERGANGFEQHWGGLFSIACFSSCSVWCSIFGIFVCNIQRKICDSWLTRTHERYTDRFSLTLPTINWPIFCNTTVKNSYDIQNSKRQIKKHCTSRSRCCEARRHTSLEGQNDTTRQKWFRVIGSLLSPLSRPWNTHDFITNV